MNDAEKAFNIDLKKQNYELKVRVDTLTSQNKGYKHIISNRQSTIVDLQSNLDKSEADNAKLRVKNKAKTFQIATLVVFVVAETLLLIYK